MVQAGTWIAKQINQGGRLQIYASRTLSGVDLNFGIKHRTLCQVY
ncbi:hypothetical protein CUZ93_2503 [Enterococcus xinjiangensis]|nr:hypothetical protein [Enterococcus lactis]